MIGRVRETPSIWAMSTPPAFARRGYARALLASVLDWAKTDGATVGLLGATEPGFPLYESTGWTTFEEWQLYVNAPSAQFAH
jgi:GNAT superfamily N-acetyltransferase